MPVKQRETLVLLGMLTLVFGEVSGCVGVGATMGVFQITPQYSNDVTDSGISDTSSLEKEITAVVNCQFYVG